MNGGGANVGHNEIFLVAVKIHTPDIVIWSGSCWSSKEDNNHNSFIM